MTGTVISHYRLLDRLGEGGMGVVFRAEDLRLGREVAIKFLRTDVRDVGQWLQRFEREARLASSLQHPHICTIHELGEHDGKPFIVMELLEGRTLRHLLEGGPVPLGLAVELAIQIGDALDAAHRRGIIHRDIKPANLFVTHGDRIKVLDFGLAKLAEEEGVAITGHLESSTPTMESRVAPELTRTGIAVGTAAYMSPEQAMGQPIDPRTDLFSFGSVLYELATGRRAFGGDDPALVRTKILNGIIIPPSTVNPHLPPALADIIERALQVDRAKRYQTAGEMLADLRTVALQLTVDGAGGRDASSTSGAHEAGSTRAKRWRLMAAAAVAVVALAGLAAVRWLGVRPAALTDRDRVLIGAFDNRTDDQVFDDTLLTALKVQLGQSPFLDIVPDARIRETLRDMGREPGDELTPALAREVCQRLGLKAMIDGSISPLGSHYVITVGATDCQSGEALAREQGEADSRERVLAELGAISSRIRTTLGESLPSIQRFDVPIEQATTPSLAALRAYALGQAERRKGRDLESIAFFNQAIQIDPEFASAYTTLSTVYGSLGELRRSEEYARLAYERQTRVSERERLFITYQYHDRLTGDQERAAETLRAWKVAYPRDIRPMNALALIHNRLGRYAEAAAEAEEALERDPGHPFPLSNLALAYRGLGRYADAAKVADEAIALGVATTPTRRLRYQMAVLLGDDTAAQHLAWAKGRSREFDLLSAQAQVLAYHGRLREASELYRRSADMARARGLHGTASGYAAHLAWTEALYREPREAIPAVRELTAARPEGEDGPAVAPRFRAVAAVAWLGLAREARELVGDADMRYPKSTVVQAVMLPSLKAALALRRGRPDEALRELGASRSTELGTVAALVPVFLRAEALSASGAWADAAEEYRRILDHRGADPFAPVVPLATLGRARALARLGDVDGSRRAYDELLAIWSEADADVWIVRPAKRERAALGATDTSSSAGAPRGRTRPW